MVEGFQARFPSLSDWQHGLGAPLSLAEIVLLGMLLLPFAIRLLARDVAALKIAMHKLHLLSKPRNLEVMHRV